MSNAARFLGYMPGEDSGDASDNYVRPDYVSAARIGEDKAEHKARHDARKLVIAKRVASAVQRRTGGISSRRSREKMAEDNASRLGPNEELERLSGLLSRACFEYLWVPEPHRPVAPPVTNILGAHSLCLLFGDERYRAAAVQHEFDCGWHVGVDDPRVGDSRPMHETTPVWPMYEGAVAEDTGENDPRNYSDHPDYVASWDQSSGASGLGQTAACDPSKPGRLMRSATAGLSISWLHTRSSCRSQSE